MASYKILKLVKDKDDKKYADMTYIKISFFGLVKSETITRKILQYTYIPNFVDNGNTIPMRLWTSTIAFFESNKQELILCEE